MLNFGLSLGRSDMRTSHRSHPSLPVYSVDKTTVFDTGSRHDTGRVVWEVQRTDPDTPSQLPEYVATCSSFHQAKMLAATLNSYEKQAHYIQELEQTIEALKTRKETK